VCVTEKDSKLGSVRSPHLGLFKLRVTFLRLLHLKKKEYFYRYEHDKKAIFRMETQRCNGGLRHSGPGMGCGKYGAKAGAHIKWKLAARLPQPFKEFKIQL